MRKLVVFFVAAGVLLRLVPHPWNVTPMTALALFSGAHLRTRTGAGILVAVLFLSDMVLGLHVTIPFTWGSFLLVLVLGRTLREGEFSLKVAGCSLAGSLLFFLITNFGVFLTGSMYGRDLAGLVACYTMALPFWRNSLIGDLSYTLLTFGLYHLAVHRLAPSRA